jgi:hypothetical protein
MESTPNRTARTFGHSWNLYIPVGLLATLFLAIFIGVARKEGNWIPVYITVGIVVALLLMFQLIRFQIGPDGFVYRTPLTSTTIDFADLSRGYFGVTYTGKTPQGVGKFCVETKDGKTFDLKLRIYTIKAAAALFDELDHHGIPIEVPDLWAANRMVNEIRRAQARMQAKSGT